MKTIGKKIIISPRRKVKLTEVDIKNLELFKKEAGRHYKIEIEQNTGISRRTIDNISINGWTEYQVYIRLKDFLKIALEKSFIS